MPMSDGYLSNDARANEVVRTIVDAGGKALCHSHRSVASEVTCLFDEAQKAVGTLNIVVVNAADFIVRPPRRTTTGFSIPNWVQLGIPMAVSKVRS